MPLLDAPQRTPPAEVIPAFHEQWQRAHTTANVKLSLASLDAANSGRKAKSLPQSWQPKCAPYLVSAMANKQWPQARAAAARGAGWTKNPTCRLYETADGTLLHRHSCPVAWPAPRDPTPYNVIEDARTPHPAS